MLLGYLSEGPLGNDDIFLVKYTKWELPQINQSPTEPPIEKEQLSIYPNPIENNLMIKGIKSNADVFIYDITGKIIYKTTTTNNIQLNASNWAKGLYVLRIKTVLDAKSFKIIKN